MSEKKTLDLSEFLVNDKDLPDVKYNGITLKVPADIPFDIMVRTAKFDSSGKADEKELLRMKKITMDILELKNDKKDIEKFMRNISFKSFNKLFIFMFEYINATSDDENQVKKKTN